MRNSLLLLFIIIFISSCKKDDGTEQDMSVTMLNVSYGSNAQQKMDVYLPGNRSTTKTKVIIMIHGGGWNTGDKTDFNEYVDSLKKRDPSYAIFNINYRLAIAPDLFPAQEQDVKAAIEFINSKTQEYQVSGKFVLIGASAGGHLALLQGYKYSTPVKPKAIIDFFGPTDLVSLYNNPPNPLVQPALLAVTGGTPTTNNTLYTQSSPINFVSSQSPPTMILHGGIDIVVSPSQSVSLDTKLFISGVTHQYVFYPSEGHGWVGANLTDSFNKILAFLAANVD
ncbi:MAG TPA: alpha/beta hydrolase [Chitinophagaceae bacterium]|jgi:acetyl esterase/lipase|nr:alpha/beta hydrolase [Chitinophagaceae bacterium]